MRRAADDDDRCQSDDDDGVQGDPSGWIKLSIDSFPLVPAADWLLLQLPTAQVA